MRKIINLLHTVSSSLKDYLVLKGVWFLKTKIDYAFIVHPRDVNDIKHKYSFLSFLSDKKILFLMKFLWPIRVAPITGLLRKDGKKLNGVVISCPLTAAQLMSNREVARKKIITAAHLAKQYGANSLGLGALTASLSRGGLDIKDIIPETIITTGRFYTVFNIDQMVLNAINAIGISIKKTRVAIIGAAGSIGAGVAQLLAYHGILDITLIDLSHKEEDVQKVVEFIRELNPNTTVKISNVISAPIIADVVVTATNRPDALLKKKHLLPGTIIVDDAQPSDVSDDIFEDAQFLVLEGGVVSAPKIHIPFNMGLQKKDDIFSCLGEVLLIAEGTVPINSPLGRSLKLDIDLMNSIKKQSERLKYKTGSFQNHKKIYTKNDIETVRKFYLNNI